MKKIIAVVLIVCLVLGFSACSKNAEPDENKGSSMNESEPAVNETLLVAAAASMKNCFEDELIPMFEEKYPNIKVDATYDSSGKLQTQIEEGADVDVFMSAAMKQMNELDEQELMVKESIVKLLENKVVLIVPKDSDKGINAFEEILKADTVAVGDPDSVPAGQYAKEIFENLGLWDEVSAKSSLGTNVTEVLNWISEGSADAGVVYSTDAASNKNVIVAAEAPEKSVSPVIYPVGIIKSSTKKDSSKLFVEFLKSNEALSVFEKYGFTSLK
ncbi:molybdate ABC transporter substrate-binding protein [Sedimentibacter sp. B4]|uniref:molybdate ABC transporter substrate-binding protein n=1 Tax=Sedimentibacter sp. B4 TaxID=304766 RepID=UPI0002F078DD|nr:molybdate ABC transporter substrate-binding protein [Sedimentibacter sp. B4]